MMWKLARGADVLVHSAMYPPAIDLTDRPVKFWSVYSYLVVYYRQANHSIVAVLHGARDVERLLRGDLKNT
jgi:plasmid stabilization system protein ParE